MPGVSYEAQRGMKMFTKEMGKHTALETITTVFIQYCMGQFVVKIFFAAKSQIPTRNESVWTNHP